MKLGIPMLIALLAAGAAQAATPASYQETYDEEGNRTWTKYAVESPAIPLYGRDATNSGPAAADGLLAFPIVGVDGPKRQDSGYTLHGQGTVSGAKEALNNKYRENM